MRILRGVATVLVPITVTAAAIASPGLARASDPAPVEVTITGHDYEELGQFTSLNGFVVSTVAPHGGVSEVPVDVTFAPYVGAPQTVHVVSGLGGAYTVTSPRALTSNTVVTATVADGSTASATVLVRVGIRCTVPSQVTHGQPVSITCHADALAFQSVLALRITGGSIPHATEFGKTDKNGNVSYTLTFAHPGQQLQVRATTATTKTYGASPSPIYALQVS